ncbi:hypothetical protein PG993_011994 [Apiospora rasikravindrae]|uniref:Uncharacterized protein n=1 Tax=Apiospora rasikravindrae TaxID=990691 RepID=A0ABR1S1A4_9PEZI
MGDSLPLVEVSRRNPTLESGIDRHQQTIEPRASIQNNGTDDRIQILLTKRLLGSSNAEVSSHIRLLRRDYARIKDRRVEHCRGKPPKRFSLLKKPSGNDEPLSCDKLFSYWLFTTSSTSTSDHNEATRVQPEDSFSEWVCRIALNLETRQPNTLQLVSMTESPEAGLTKYIFSSWHYFITTVSGRLGTIYQLPVRIILATVAHYWGIEMMTESVLPDTMVGSFRRSRPLGPPSTRPSKPSEEHFNSPPTILWGHGNSRPGNLDPSRGDHEILLTWRRQVTRFDSDLAVYIWEYQKSIPEVEFAKIILRPGKLAQQPLRLVISFRASHSNDHFTSLRNKTTDEVGADRLSIATANHISWLPTYEALVSIWKWAQEKGVASACQQRLDVLEEDLRYLDDELKKLGGHIEHDKAMLRQHFQLSSDMTGFRLTLLAGIFLPLSFTTSLFGMNIQTKTQEGPGGFSNFTKDSFVGLPVEVKNSSQALISSVATNSPLTYQWTTFAVTSLCILATLPLTLTIGWILRSIVVLSATYVVYWRAALVVVGVPFVLMSMFGSFISYRLTLAIGDLSYSDSLDWILLDRYETTAMTLHYIVWAFNGSLGLYLIV